MPLYQYQCGKCKRVLSRFKAFVDRETSVICDCGEPANRVFSSVQLNTRPEHLKDENKYALGFSAQDRLERMRRDDKIYKERADRESVARKEAEAEMRKS